MTATEPERVEPDRTTARPVLTPAQERTLALLRRSPEPVIFDPAFIDELLEQVETALAAFEERLGPDTELWVSKHRLAAVLGCEAQAVAPDQFHWAPPVAGGQVAHRAIQLGLNWRGEPTPAGLVDDALARLADEDHSLGVWVAGLSTGDLADLRGLAVERVTKFLECFPPLDPRSRPMTEARVQWPLRGPVVLAGKVDLVIGRPEGAESRKVIVDLKTGRHRAQHRDDLRFYALVETLRTRVPPRKLASFYLDVGDADTEDVTDATLRSAARRLLDGIHTMIELEIEGRPPVKRPGSSCRWCVLADGCEEGRAHLEAVDRDDR